MKAAVLVFLLLVCAAAAFTQNTSLRWYSFSSGFGSSSSTTSRTASAIGQPFVGTSQGSNSVIVSGFLADTLLRGRVVSVKEQDGLPKTFELSQNYPNPFNPTTTIKYQLPVTAFVTLKVFDIVGREVTTLVSDLQQPGYYSLVWNAGGIASGVYFYRLRADAFSATRKLLLVR